LKPSGQLGYLRGIRSQLSVNCGVPGTGKEDGALSHFQLCLAHLELAFAKLVNVTHGPIVLSPRRNISTDPRRYALLIPLSAARTIPNLHAL